MTRGLDFRRKALFGGADHHRKILEKDSPSHVVQELLRPEFRKGNGLSRDRPSGNFLGRSRVHARKRAYAGEKRAGIPVGHPGGGGGFEVKRPKYSH